ncbi:hypothetical protein EDC14_100445 [Hydrogenispora ethanolica]|uniref:Uncharacterized protein n=1 Tax=Hydrogenispora ethanolica TaxID=1082276 RepID=A0A4R1S4S1_HYDET|nr:hypothetical protein EDC14_100445 [Hydrogenispora ethanolica]
MPQKHDESKGLLRLFYPLDFDLYFIVQFLDHLPQLLMFLLILKFEMENFGLQGAKFGLHFGKALFNLLVEQLEAFAKGPKLCPQIFKQYRYLPIIHSNNTSKRTHNELIVSYFGRDDYEYFSYLYHYSKNLVRVFIYRSSAEVMVFIKWLFNSTIESIPCIEGVRRIGRRGGCSKSCNNLA